MIKIESFVFLFLQLLSYRFEGKKALRFSSCTSDTITIQHSKIVINELKQCLSLLPGLVLGTGDVQMQCYAHLDFPDERVQTSQKCHGKVIQWLF